MRILALWLVSFFVAVLLAVESLFAVQCSATPITGLGFTEAGNPVVVRIDGQVEQWGGIFDRATYLYTNGHVASIDGLAYSPDGKILASASEDYTIRLWDGVDGHHLKTLSANEPQTAVAFTPDGKYLVSADMGGRLIIWDILSGEKVKETYYYGLVVTGALSPDGDYLAMGTSNGHVVVAEVATGKPIASIHLPKLVEQPFSYPPNIQQIDFAPDGKAALVVNLNADKSVYLFETQSWTVLDKFAVDRPNCAVYSPDGQVGIICDFGMLTLWDLKQHEIVSRFPIAADNVVFSKDGKTFWTIDRYPSPWYPSLNEYDFHTGTRLKQIPLYFQLPALGGLSWQFPLAISPDGTRIATSVHNGRISIFDTRTGQRQQVLFGHASSVLGGQVVGNELLTYSDDRTAILWDIPTGTLVDMFEGQWDPVTTAALSSDKRYLLTASDAWYGDNSKTVRLWDVQSRQILQILRQSTTVSVVNFSADGQYALTGTVTGEVTIWRVPSGEQLETVDIGTQPVNSVSLDGSNLLIGTSIQIIKTDFARISEKRQRRYVGNSLTKLVVAPRTQQFATIEANQTRLWDAQTLTPIRVLTTSPAKTLAFSGDGNTILIGEESSVPHLIDARTGITFRILCPHPLTRRWLVVSGIIFGLLGLRVLQAIFWVVRQLRPVTTQTAP